MLFILVLPFEAWAAKPEGWFLAGTSPGDYEMVLDESVAHAGKSSARLASTRTPDGFGTIMQSFRADEYRGKRLQLSAHVKAKDVENWAGVWMRVDGPENKVMSFDNMQSRPIRATQDWTAHVIVLDVPPTAKAIAFGLLLHGGGTVWLDDLMFKVVDNTVPITGSGNDSEKPVNLDLEH